jgi:glycosyltransferase involved in cell wall biosynthesis
MIIGIDASRANREHKSGTEWYSYHLIRHLARIDDRNEYILYSDAPLTGGLVDLGDENDDDKRNGQGPVFKNGYQVINSPHGNFKAKYLKWPYEFFWTQGRLSIEMIFRRPDILFVPAHTLPIIHPKYSIVTIHDIGFERDKHLYRFDSMGPQKSRSRKLINFLVRIFTYGKYGANSLDYLTWSTTYALRHAKVIITVSEFTKNEIINYYGDCGKKIRVVYNGFNSKLYQRIDDREAVAQARKKFGIPEKYYLYVGRLERKKNIPQLIDAYAILREKNKDIRHKLVLVGDAGYGYDEVKYAIKEYSLDEDVVMPGWVPEKYLPYLYSGAAAFIFPSLYEGFGIPLLQAMASGVPCIASRSSSLPEIAGQAALFFNPKNIISIAEAMEKIVKDEELRKNLTELGISRSKEFSWEKCAHDTFDVLKESWLR